MPKAEPHFDVPHLLEQVHEQDLGLIVSTNNPGGFRRVLYTEMRRKPHLRCTILTDPGSANRLFLLSKPLEAANGETQS